MADDDVTGEITDAGAIECPHDDATFDDVIVTSEKRGGKGPRGRPANVYTTHKGRGRPPDAAMNNKLQNFLASLGLPGEFDSIGIIFS